ncbi:hypothetical protein BJ741DRAFT_585059 [Chytriomyces cf. hyalinus JEL632]|nr:hypothetical protein BJ741DRAFT_585059 [Chytriomyces cf. hyalinus JEL632]
MVKIYYALSNNCNLKVLSVTINTTHAAVDDLKEAIHTKKRNALSQVDADNLVLVRIFKEEMGRTPPNTSRLRRVLPCVGASLASAINLHGLSKTIQKLEITTVTPNTYSNTQSLFEVESDYFSGSGLSSTKLVLYCRKDFHDQFKFLRERVLGDSCFRMDPWPSRHRKYRAQRHVRLDEFLDKVEGKQIVFLDGYVSTEALHVTANICCNAWRESLLKYRGWLLYAQQHPEARQTSRKT